MFIVRVEAKQFLSEIPYVGIQIPHTNDPPPSPSFCVSIVVCRWNFRAGNG